GTLPPEPEHPAAAPDPQPPSMPRYEDMTTAEQFAVIYPDRAAAIRRHGGMPPAATFPPPDRDLIGEIVTSNSQVFLALDADLPPGDVTESATLSHATVA
ncbi:MAG TPA: hypothetical protein VKI44_13970, partial [Acetobacteraceae bacterium]|nr:hypothetical protein [Acetobacteraceae bacterium]